MRPIRSYATLLILFIPQVLISLKLWYLEPMGLMAGLQHLLISSMSLLLIVLLWYLLLSFIRRAVAVPLHITFVGLYLVLQAYHWLRHEPLSFLLIYKNGADLFTGEALLLVLGSVTPLGWLTIGAFAFVLVFAQRRFDIFFAVPRFRRPVPAFFALVLANGALVVAAPTVGNEYYEFARSVYHYASENIVADEDLPLYPYVKEVSPADKRHIADDSSRPHIFLVMLESFSASYMDRIENGKPVTPFLDELKNKGIYAEEFYSASVETSKGQFAALCSVYPSSRVNVFTHYPRNEFRCLPEILGENGYVNVFMKAFDSLRFENTGNFVRANGFDYAHGMDDKFVSEEERRQYKFGWGIQDNIFYQKTFKYLDELHLKHGKDARFFVSTMSVTNHMMFDDIPQNQKYIYPNASSHHQNYTNSMHLTDLYLREFFHQLEQRDYLANSLIIITGDNGFPMGQHRNFHNTKTGFNELYKTPLLVLWGDQLQPQRLEDRAYSQLDIAPTVLDLLNIKTSNHFVGQSLFKIDEQSHFVPLIQPFDGTWLASIRYPYKLMLHKKSGKEYLFNLEQDPLERNNLLGSLPDDQGFVDELRRDIRAIEMNEAILKENRVYPTDVNDGFRVRLSQTRLEAEQTLEFELLGEADSEALIDISVRNFDPRKREWIIQRVDIPAISRLIPGHLLRSGINRIRLVVRDDNTVVQSLNQDVYLESEKTQLLSDAVVAGWQKWGELQVNQGVDGHPLTIMRHTFPFGLGTHASSEYRVLLDGRFSYFITAYGLGDEARCGDGAIFQIWADDKPLHESSVIIHGQVKHVGLDVEGVKELKLITRANESIDCDHTNWVNPVLYR